MISAAARRLNNTPLLAWILISKEPMWGHFGPQGNEGARVFVEEHGSCSEWPMVGALERWLYSNSIDILESSASTVFDQVQGGVRIVIHVSHGHYQG